MSYKPIPYTYGTKTLAEIEALTGMQEGDTVYNTTWQIIEIYSGTNWVKDEGARFITGGWGVTTIPANEIRVWADMTNDSAMYYYKGLAPSANGNNLSWTTPTAYWDDLSNINNWKVTAWTWASETTTPSDSETKGESYWDYYPNGDSPWEEQSNTTTTTTTIETTTGTDNGTPGFESFIAIIAINLIILVFRKKRK